MKHLMACRFVFCQSCQWLAEVVSETYKPRNNLVGSSPIENSQAWKLGMAAPFPSFDWMSAGYWQLLKGKSCSPSAFPHGNFPLAIRVRACEGNTRGPWNLRSLMSVALVSAMLVIQEGHFSCILSVVLKLSTLVLTELCIFHFCIPKAGSV